MWVQIQPPSPTGCVTQDELLNFSELWFPLLQNVENCSLSLWAAVRVKMGYKILSIVPGHKVSTQ